MSLKAKIEAVIYASEEPVTLAQLAGLLGHEAQNELDQIAARQHSLVLAAESGESEQPDSDFPEGAIYDTSAAMGDGPAPEVEPAPEPVAGEESGSELEQIKDENRDALAEKRRIRDQERRLREYFREILDRLIADYATSERGLEIREVAGGFRMATKPEYHDAVRGFIRGLKPPLKLSLQALETLAVVAYKQPVTAPEITEIRGVDSGGVLGSLMARKLITTAGRKQVIGRPILYKTTKDFLLRFGLKDLSELPSIEEFEKMAGELAEQEEIPMEAPKPNAEEVEAVKREAELVELEKGVTAPQADGDSEPV
ncbi:segregation and condensation protein B [Granulicella rosea]|uniref:Segregation and condensation protein B n=1 Tax=Granulicella rosea TaxID=474952 RepID=A0A239LFV3_9BACT|nr:SMC-Scp complex subunit ScpB [Granulicella rosea]SNT29516.1 segregation and condensation protein B [Granulicella rosea]